MIDYPDRRQIVREGGRAVIRNDDSIRFERRFRDAHSVPGRDGSRTTTYFRPGGVQVVSVVDDNGRLLHRYRRGPDGRTIVLIDNRRYWRAGAAGLFLGGLIVLAPPIISIPRERYIVDYDTASYDDVYDALTAEPVEPLDRLYSLDEIRQSRSLRDRMRRVDLDSINFAFGSWAIDPSQYGKLERIAEAINRALERRPDEVFLIEGHTDAVGSDEDNLTLSDRRAEAVAEVLSEQFNVPPENLTSQGYGEQDLKIDTPGPEPRNRYVAVRRITPLLSRSEE